MPAPSELLEARTALHTRGGDLEDAYRKAPLRLELRGHRAKRLGLFGLEAVLPAVPGGCSRGHHPHPLDEAGRPEDARRPQRAGCCPGLRALAFERKLT